MRLRLATIGTGYFSQFHHRAWTRIPEVEPVAVASLELAHAQAATDIYGIPKAFDNVEAMLAATKPDLLDIISPPETHLGFITLAARHGVNVICQKAFCRNLDEAREAAAIARAAGITLVVHENFRFQPWHQEIRALLAAGTIGEVYQGVFRLRPGDGQGTDAYLDRQPYFRTMQRLLVHETAIHHIDLFRFLFGEVAWVFADLRRVNPVIAAEDAGIILFGLESGSRAVFDGNRCSDHIALNRRLTMGEMLVEGSAGTLRLDGSGRIFLRRFGDNTEHEHSFAWSDTDFGGDCVYRLQRAAVECLLTGALPQNTADAYLRNLVLEDAIYASHDQGRIIDVSRA